MEYNCVDDEFINCLYDISDLIFCFDDHDVIDLSEAGYIFFFILIVRNFDVFLNNLSNRRAQ